MNTSIIIIYFFILLTPNIWVHTLLCYRHDFSFPFCDRKHFMK